METSSASTAVVGRLHQNFLTPSSRHSSNLLSASLFSARLPLSSLKLQKQFHIGSHNALQSTSLRKYTNLLDTYSETNDLADIDWDDLGFGFVSTDYMYVMKCTEGGSFSNGNLQQFGNIELSPSAAVLNYGQGLFESLKAYRKEDGNILLFRPEENALRMRLGAEQLCMPSPSVEQFVEAVKATVLANRCWVPPQGKGSLYIRPLLLGSWAVLGLTPAPEYTFLVYVSPVGNYFKEGPAPINLLVERDLHRAAPGGTGGVKIIGNYAAGTSISTPSIKGTILSGITRKIVIDVALDQGFQVEERQVSLDELLEADEVFCTGTAVVVSPVGSVTYLGKRVSYGDQGVGTVSQILYSVLTKIQMGLTQDKMNRTIEL